MFRNPGAPGANQALLGIEIATLTKHDLLFIGNALGSGRPIAPISVNAPIGAQSFLTHQRASCIHKEPIGFLCLR
jgi:hypothetical protein